MRPRLGSVIAALAYLLCGIALAHTAPRFGPIYADFYGSRTIVPFPTLMVLNLAPVGWNLLAICSAVLLIIKDLRASTSRIPNWPFAVLLVLIFAAMALFLPLVVDIGRMEPA